MVSTMCMGVLRRSMCLWRVFETSAKIRSKLVPPNRKNQVKTGTSQPLFRRNCARNQRNSSSFRFLPKSRFNCQKLKFDRLFAVIEPNLSFAIYKSMNIVGWQPVIVLVVAPRNLITDDSSSSPKAFAIQLARDC